MYLQFPLYQSPLELAAFYWKNLLLPGDTVIDATCGHGKDTLKLAEMVIKEKKGAIFAYDIQPEALESAKEYLSQQLSKEQFDQIHFHLKCHSLIKEDFQSETIKLIVYNLGYLPGGNKMHTTQSQTTLESLQQSLDLIIPGGAISITCYPGHPEGLIEEQSIIDFVATLSKQQWSCCYHQWLNRKNGPSLLFLQKAYNTMITK